MISPIQYLKKILPLVIVAVPALLLDIITKWLVRMHIPQGSGYSIIRGFFNLRHDRNTGAAFGIFSDQRTLLIIITIVALIFIFIYSFRFQNSRWMQTSLGFLLGGAVGNFIDRVYLGSVVDFLQFGIESKNLFWPTFNVADVSVCIGAGMLIVYLFRIQHRNVN
ncbi:MAG: signal peptidase II [Candidatus Poribacteria bacterium]|nr:signal peptidase II [Candidatus Poribacteria bacterium]MDE0313510.1 signal peptidase II [Candidatus Poribacteria bacterium]